MAKQTLAESVASATLMQRNQIVIISYFWWNLLSSRAPHQKHNEGTVKELVHRVMQPKDSYQVSAII